MVRRVIWSQVGLGFVIHVINMLHYSM
jgi:hypothetical protein